MSDDMNLFSERFYRKFLAVSNDTIKSSNFPLPYPGNIDCVWVITLEKIVELKIQVLASDLIVLFERLLNYLKTRTCGCLGSFILDLISTCCKK